MKPKYEALQDAAVPNDWRVEAILEDGAVEVTLFSGPDSEIRANEYADWKNSRV